VWLNGLILIPVQRARGVALIVQNFLDTALGPDTNGALLLDRAGVEAVHLSWNALLGEDLGNFPDSMARNVHREDALHELGLVGDYLVMCWTV
jgi:hypothetical protein